MTSVTVCVKFPPELKKAAQQIVEKGQFKSLSELITSGTRKEVERYGPEHAADEVHKIRTQMWNEYLQKANGNESKAVKLFAEDIKELEKKSTIPKYKRQ